MSKLIKNEITKIFKKKSIYITLLVVLAFIILTNCIYKFFYNTGNYIEYGENYIQYAKEEIAKLDPKKPSDAKMYIELKTTLDIYEMTQKYEEIVGKEMFYQLKFLAMLMKEILIYMEKTRIMKK